MKQVKLNKAELIQTIKKNMELHVKEYNEMMDVFRTMASQKVGYLLKEIDGGDDFNLSIDLEKPRSSEKSYLNALEMLEMEVEENVILDNREFKQLVKDEWDFSRSFAMSKAAYLGL